MKLLVLAFALMTAHAQANIPEVVAKRFTCEALQQKLSQHSSLIVVKSFMGIKKRLLVESNADCDSSETTETAYFKTMDDKFCEVGEICERERSYSSGSSYDSGWSSSGSSYDSGWSSSGSSSSGSSSSGSNYNPPSSGSTGSNYNPPSSGTRGPRYCPGCAL